MGNSNLVASQRGDLVSSATHNLSGSLRSWRPQLRFESSSTGFVCSLATCVILLTCDAPVVAAAPVSPQTAMPKLSAADPKREDSTEPVASQIHEPPRGQVQGPIDSATVSGANVVQPDVPLSAPAENPIQPQPSGPPTENGLRFVGVSIGDSYAAGEGNPVVPAEIDDTYARIAHANWGEPTPISDPEFRVVAGQRDVVDTVGELQSTGNGQLIVTEDELIACHRSDNAGAPRAHRMLRERYPDVDFRFAHFACSGARTSHLMRTPYSGADRDVEVRQPVQVDRARAFAELHGEFDALHISVGGNDVGFDDAIVACILTDCSQDIPEVPWDGEQVPMTDALERLSGRYEALADYIDHPPLGAEDEQAAAPQVPNDVLITAYPDPVRNSEGLPCEQYEGNAQDEPLPGIVERAETEWASHEVLGDPDTPGTLNYAIYETAALEWWPIDGHLAAFAGADYGHGYCAREHFINTNIDALEQQGDDMDLANREKLETGVKALATATGAIIGTAAGFVVGVGPALGNTGAAIGYIVGESSK